MDLCGGGLLAGGGDVGGKSFVTVQQSWASDDVRLRVRAGSAGV
jgi:hypothetical protein